MTVAVFYTSLSGNTREAAEIVAGAIGGTPVDIVQDAAEREALLDELRAGRLAMALFGTYTWGDGELPEAMRRFLRRLLIEEGHLYLPAMPPTAVFGTGDSIFPRYCRAADAVYYHLEKHGVRIVLPVMKIEQSPYGLDQAPRLEAWAEAAQAAAGAGRPTARALRRSAAAPLLTRNKPRG